MSASLSIVLVHHPVLNRDGRIVTSAVTNLDVHDLCRTGKTYGVRRVYIATPVPGLRRLAEKVVHHWEEGPGAAYNETRREALALARTVHDLDQALLEIEREEGALPKIVVTSAKEGPRRITFPEMRAKLESEASPHLLVLGTGWGLAAEVLDRADLFLEPIRGVGDWNHLPVRSAAAIMLDRLFG